MKRTILILLVAGLLALGGQAFAELCTIDDVPAATLLLPGFQVDIGDADGNGEPDCADGIGVDTLFSINNASAAPALAHVTLWTDWSFPTLDFDVFLTGYDVQSVSLCSAIGLGILPVTADEQNDGGDLISPHGPPLDTFSDNPLWDGSFPNCAGVFPFPVPIVTGSLLDRVQNGHAGYPVATLGGDCVGQAWNGVGACAGGVCPAGTIARGYVTIDNVNQCSTIFPNEPGYFSEGGNGIANNINQLWGDWFLVDRLNDFAQGNNLVHIEAAIQQDPAMVDPTLNLNAVQIPVQNPASPNSPQVGSVTNPNGYTFYGRYTTNNAGGLDNREPLGTTWGARYLSGGDFTGGTTYTAWRDSTFDQVNNNDGWVCGICAAGSGIGPPWCPLNENQVVCWDEKEDAVELCRLFGGGVISPPTDPTDPVCFPLEVNFVQVGQGPLSPPWPFGWCFINLNHTFGAPPTFNGIAQSWVGVNMDALARFSVGFPAIELSDACNVSSLANQIVVGDIPDISGN